MDSDESEQEQAAEVALRLLGYEVWLSHGVKLDGSLAYFAVKRHGDAWQSVTGFEKSKADLLRSYLYSTEQHD